MKTIFLIFLLFNVLFSSGQQQTFVTALSIDSLKTIPTGSCKGLNGSYFIYGTTDANYPYSMFAIKFDQNDDTLFSVKIDRLGIESGFLPVNAKILAPTFDGGCAILGSYQGSDAVFIKLDSTGAITLQRNYGSSSLMGLTRIIQTRDSGYVIMFADKIIGPATGRNFNQLLKINQNGDIMWNREVNDAIGDIQENQNGDLYVISPDQYLIKFDANGNYIWWNEFPGTYLEEIIGFNGSSIFVKTYASLGSSDSSILYKVDTNGTFLNGYYFQSKKILDADLLTDGSLQFILYSGDSTSVLKLDSTFQIQYNTSFTGLNNGWQNYFNTDLVECVDNTVLLSGVAGTGANLTTLIIKIDSTGHSICNSNPSSVGLHLTNTSTTLTNLNLQGTDNYLFTPYSNFIFSELRGVQFNTECSSTSISDPANEKLYSLVPNPTTGKSIIYGSSLDDITLEVYNLNGQILASIENLILPYCLDIENYPKGMYFVKLYNESKSDVIKMLVQ